MLQVNGLTGLALTAAAGYLVYLLSPILTPFLVAAIIAYIFDPVVDKFEARKWPRTLGVALVFVVITLIVLLVVLVLAPLLEEKIVAFARRLPGYIDTLQTSLLPWLQAKLGLPVADLDLAGAKEVLVDNWQNVGNWLARILGSVSKSGATVLLWAANLALIPVVTFYLLRDWDHIVARIYELIPHRYKAVSAEVAHDTNNVLSSFLRGQLSVMLALAIIYSTGLSIVGLDLAIPIGLMAGLVSFVPYLGFAVGIVVAGIAAALEFQAVLPIVWVVVVFAIGQMLEGMVLTPLLVGDKIGLHPVAVIFAVMAGGQLFGFFGILLGLPVAAIIMVMLRHAHTRYSSSRFFQQD